MSCPKTEGVSAGAIIEVVGRLPVNTRAETMTGCVKASPKRAEHLSSADTSAHARPETPASTTKILMTPR